MNKIKVKLTVFQAEAKDSESLGESDYLLNHQGPTGNSLGSFVRKPKKRCALTFLKVCGKLPISINIL